MVMMFPPLSNSIAVSVVTAKSNAALGVVVPIPTLPVLPIALATSSPVTPQASPSATAVATSATATFLNTPAALATTISSAAVLPVGKLPTVAVPIVLKLPDCDTSKMLAPL